MARTFPVEVNESLLTTWARLGLKNTETESASRELIDAIRRSGGDTTVDDVSRLSTALESFNRVAHVDAGWENATAETVMLPSEKASASIAGRLVKCMRLVNSGLDRGLGMPQFGDGVHRDLYGRGAGELSSRFFHLFSDLHRARTEGRADYFITSFDASDETRFAEKIRTLARSTEVKHVKNGDLDDDHQRRFPELYESFRDQVALLERDNPTIAFVLFFEIKLGGANEWFHFFFACDLENRSWNVIPRSAFEKIYDTARSVARKNKSRACWTCARETEKIMKCSSCRVAAYCSRACQCKDWKNHKKTCR